MRPLLGQAGFIPKPGKLPACTSNGMNAIMYTNSNSKKLYNEHIYWHIYTLYESEHKAETDQCVKELHIYLSSDTAKGGYHQLFIRYPQNAFITAQ